MRRLARLLGIFAAGAASAGEPSIVAPVPRGESVPDHAWDLQKLTLDLRVDPEAGRVEGTATFDIARLTPGPFVLDGVALEILDVDAPWRAEGDRLAVEVEGDAARVTVRYSATPRTGLHFRRRAPDSPDTYGEVWSQGEGEDNRFWFPGYDHPNDRFAYEGRIAGPPGWKVMTNSGPDLVNYLVMVAMGPYDAFGEGANVVWAPPGTPRVALVPILDPIPGMLAHLGGRSGVPYPWGVYRQVIVQRFIYGGMENTSASIESARILTGPINQATRPSTESLVAHELAHQWYGDLLTPHDWHHLWLSEGFATFMAADWMAVQRGDARWAASVRGWYTASLGAGSLTGAYFLGADTPASHNVYAKGAAVLNMLRVQIGDDAFWRGIRLYTARNQHTLVTTGDLRRAMEEESGHNLDWFFQQWTELPYVPTLKASWTWAAGTLNVSLEQTGEPVYALPISVQLGDTGRVETTWMDQAHLGMRIPLDAAPAWVAIDPAGAVLADLQITQSASQWSAQLERSSAPYARLVAAEFLGRQTGAGSVVARAALARVLGSRTEALDVRKAAAAALGEQRAADPLLAVAADPEPLIRLAVAEALIKAARPQDAPALAALRAKEANADIRAALHDALAAADPRRAAAAARAGLRTPAAVPGFDAGTHDVELRTHAKVLGEHGDLGDLAILLAAPASRDRRTGGLSAAARIVSRMDPGSARDAARVRVARSAEAMLDDLDLRGREAAVGLLREVGDADSATRLERFLREEETAPLIEAARAAITAIRARPDAAVPATPNEVDARLRALEERLRAVEERESTWMPR